MTDITYVAAPDYRGYAHLGTGQHILSNCGNELVISLATDSEKFGRTVGDTWEDTPGHMSQPEDTCVRIRFENVAGLDALEKQLRYLREECFPDTKGESNE